MPIPTAAAASSTASPSATERGREDLERAVIAALRTVFDPEIPVNIYDLGLIYDLDIDPSSGAVQVRMTLTAPGCPVAQTFPGVVAAALEAVPGVSTAEVEVVWDPPWSQELMSEAARLELGFF
jgi:FeS assembly SUF system protein